jgi:hypothetical protein
MFKRTAVRQAVALAIALPSVAVAEVSVTGYVKNETSIFTEGGQVTGQARSMLDDTEYDGGELLKFENSARLFLTGDLAKDTTWSADLNVIYDAEGVNSDYKGYRLYSQHDWLRELYVDTKLADWQFRIGKQQVVWGTADGIKLLDIINPTDYREFNQNTFEDSRIPIWMLKAEKNLTDRSNIQFIVSQHEENKFPGLNDASGTYSIDYNNPFAGQPTNNSRLDGVDRGQPFIAKGVDTITGQVNGFLNIAPALGGVAQTFSLGATQLVNAYNGAFAAAGIPMQLAPGLTGLTSLTVQDFIDGVSPGLPALGPAGLDFSAPPPTAPQLFGCGQGPIPADSTACLNFYTQLTNQNTTNLLDPSGARYDTSDPQSAFEYLGDTTFATFNTFALANSKYRRDYPDSEEPNLGFRWKNTTAGGFSYSLNYFYAYDPNPSVSIRWENAEGEQLVPQKIADPLGTGKTTVLLRDGSGSYYGANAPLLGFDQTTGMPQFGTLAASSTPTLVFEETVHRIHNVGGAFDAAIDQFAVPTVVRGELLYQKDVHVPIVDRGEMAIGNLTEALTVERADLFKYVLGVDVTVFTNLLVSGQFIQFINLDHLNDDSVVPGYKRYTGDQAVLHLDNGLQEAEEYKEFYSLFFSKPFGPSQEHRWNNITIYEENDGWWNRFDLEYSFTDELIGTAELNLYWGSENTLFGQFKNSSNFQIGMKYIFD